MFFVVSGLLGVGLAKKKSKMVEYIYVCYGQRVRNINHNFVRNVTNTLTANFHPVVAKLTPTNIFSVN